MSTPLHVAAIQLQNSSDREKNQRTCTTLITEAARNGASFIATPENTDAIAPRQQRWEHAQPLEGELISTYRNHASVLGIWLLIGSVAERVAGSEKVHNTSVLIDPTGQINCVYRKIHLFDASVSDGSAYQESAAVIAGDEVNCVTLSSDFKLGMSICYDVRFPELYRELRLQQASVLSVPSAFTVPTGAAHWELLLRARAVENQCFVIAPAQAGDHGNERTSYGHSLIIDPWGTVLAEAPSTGSAIIYAHFDFSKQHAIRTKMPVHQHHHLLSKRFMS